jgi:hypothetical protein
MVNAYEVLTADVLRRAADTWGADVSKKVRVADALVLDGSGISNEQYRYGLKAHFDFVVTEGNESMSCFAVEFDGPHHRTDRDAVRRDALKEDICDRLGMPLLRISAEHIAGTTRDTILAWLIDVWFVARACEQRGLPADWFKHWLTAIGKGRDPDSVLTFAPEARYRIFMFLADDAGGLEILTRPLGGVTDFRVSFEVPFVASHDDPDGDGLSHGSAFVTLRDGGGIVGESRCRGVRFGPIRPRDVAAELAILDAANAIEELELGVAARDVRIKSKADLDKRKSEVEDWEWFPVISEGLPVGAIEDAGHDDETSTQGRRSEHSAATTSGRAHGFSRD